MNLNHLLAKLNLAFHLMLRIFKRLTFKASPGLKEFISFYQNDHLVTFTLEEKNLLQEASRCLHCGLCDSDWPSQPNLKGSSQTPPSQWSSLIRSVPNFAKNVFLEDADLEHAKNVEALCPEKVPLKKIGEFIRKQSRSVG